MLLTCEELTLRSLATGLFRKSALCEESSLCWQIAAMRTDLEIITLQEGSQTEKYVISLAYRNYKHELIYKAEVDSQT